MYQSPFYSNELYHYGVPGMKWGVRRYTNADGSLNAKGIKKYARAGYAQDSYNSNKTRAGKVYDKLTSAHKYGGDIKYNLSSQKANKARAEKYVADQKAKKEAANTPEARAARRKTAVKAGVAIAGTALAAYGAYKVGKFVREKNRDIRVGKELLNANKLLDMNKGNFDTRGKGFTNEQRKAVNDQFNKYAKTLLDGAQRSGNYQADRDSFGTAARNVYDYYRNRR